MLYFYPTFLHYSSTSFFQEYVVNKLGAAFGPILMRSEENSEPGTGVLSNAICRSIITNYEILFEVCLIFSQRNTNRLPLSPFL